MAGSHNKQGLLAEGLAGVPPMDSPLLSSCQPVPGAHPAADGQYIRDLQKIQQLAHTSALWC